MKQEIAQSQFEELNEQQKKRYITWTLKKSTENRDYTTVYRSIGHLIWFLDEHKDYVGWWGMTQAVKGGWYLEGSHGLAEGEELVDALWEAVKIVLSRTNAYLI